MPERPDARTRRFVAKRAAFLCEYCLTPAAVGVSPYSAEHILPRSRGGGHKPENLAFSCQGCNGHKATKITGVDPVTRKIVPLFNPRRQSWSQHFGWAAGGTRIVGKGLTGRATVVELQLNRPGLQNLRRLMVLAGIHPPELRQA